MADMTTPRVLVVAVHDKDGNVKIVPISALDDPCSICGAQEGEMCAIES